MSGEGKIRETKARVSGGWGWGLATGVQENFFFLGGVIESFCILILVVVIQVCGFIKSHRSAPAGDGLTASTRRQSDLRWLRHPAQGWESRLSERRGRGRCDGEGPPPLAPTHTPGGFGSFFHKF